MACGVTKNGIVCDNPGASNHAGPHSGLSTTMWFGIGISLRNFWSTTDTSTAVQRPMILGERLPEDLGVLTAMGLNKSGTQLLTASTWTPLTPWTVRSGFPDTTPQGSGLIFTRQGNITVTASVTFGATTTSSHGWRLLLNGVVLETFTTTVSGATVLNTSAPFMVKYGDIVIIEGFQANATTAQRTVQTSTYLETTVV